MRLLNKEEIKEIFKFLSKHYYIDTKFLKKLEKEYYFYISKEGKIFMSNIKIPENKMKFERIGLYILKKEKDGYRFSIEGSQIFGILSNKVLNLSEDIMYNNLKDIKLDVNDGYYIVKINQKDFAGSCKVKNGILKDFIPSNRKIKKK